jgi:type I restriction enzyme S subunit
MNAERLLAHYEQIADAPDAIARLRIFILDLAVRGKLLPQDAGDEPVPKRYLNELGASDLPANWSVLNFGKFCDIEGGSQPPKNQFIDEPREGYVQLFQIRDLGERGVPTYIPINSARSLSKEGDILIGRYGASVGKVFWAQTGAYNVAMAKFIWPHDAFIPNFAFLLLKSDFLQGPLAKATRSAQAGFNKGDLAPIDFPLPPLAEQHRIVAKFDELMVLCHQLEAARGSREAVRDRLTAASLARLNAPDPETFQDDARFALDALPALSTRPDQIKQLRQTILNLAVRGKLVPQDPNDEPATNFDRAIPDDLARPFEIPRAWNWARLHTLGKLKGGGTPSKAREDFWNGNIPWVSPKDMKVDYIAEAQMSISEAAIAGSAANLIDAASVLFVVRGMILAHSFPVAISRAPLAINQDMKALVLEKPEMAEYILRTLKGIKPEMLKRVQRSSHGTCRLEGSDYSDFLIPIPPLAEQDRIVAKVDALMTLCDQLEASLTATAATRRRLLDALLAEALAPAEDRELEAAE